MRRLSRAMLAGLALWATGAGLVQANPDALDILLPEQRMPAPPFSLTDLNGHRHSLSDYRGKLVLLTFWATWCAPCRHEMPVMQALWQRYRQDGLVLLAVNIEKDNAAAMRTYAKTMQLTFPLLPDTGARVQKAYEVYGLPTTYLIGRDGKLSAKVVGERPWADITYQQWIADALTAK